MIVVHLHCGVGTFDTRTGVKTLGWLQKTSTVLFQIVCLKAYSHWLHFIDFSPVFSNVYSNHMA